MFAAIGKNKFKTALIVALILGFLYAIVYFVAVSLDVEPSNAVTIALLFSLLTSFGSYWFSDKMVLSMSGARPANDQQDKMLKNILEGLLVASGLPMPKLYVINDPSPNAFATGRNPKNAAVCVTTGLLDTMDYYQIEGVLAHELAHIKNYDILLQTVASVMIGAAMILANIWSRSLFWGRGRRRDDNNGGANIILFVIGLIFTILAPIAGQLMRMALSRNREYLADATAIEFTRNPEGLATALEKLGGLNQPVARANSATEGLYITNPMAANGRAKDLFSTHPPIEKRVEAIRSLR